MTIDEQVKEIKQSFRQMMDGVVAKSMRDKGVNYHLNWGATLPRLKAMAEEITNTQHPSPNPQHPSPNPQHPSPNPQYQLAIALWKENARSSPP